MSGHVCKRCRGGIPTDELLLTTKGAWHESCYVLEVSELQRHGVAPKERSEPVVKHMYRVEATFKVKAVFDVVAFSEDEAQELAASQPTSVHVKAINLAIAAGEFDVDCDTVEVEDLGEASEADGERSDQVLAIHP